MPTILASLAGPGQAGKNLLTLVGPVGVVLLVVVVVVAVACVFVAAFRRPPIENGDRSTNFAIGKLVKFSARDKAGPRTPAR